MRANRSQPPIRFPRALSGGLVITDDDHRFLTTLIGPCHGGTVEAFLARAPATSGGRRFDINDPDIELLLNAIGVEVIGFMKLEDEESARPRNKPKRGGTAARLLSLYETIEQHLS
jgi:hypothetical protein